MENYAKLQISLSFFKIYQEFIENSIKPTLGKILLEEPKTIGLQRLYKHLLKTKNSYRNLTIGVDMIKVFKSRVISP